MSVEPPEEVSLLLVDDRPANLLALESILDLPGYRLVRATSGPEALEKVAREDFALILLDVAMPEMTGFDVVDRLKRDERIRSIPILFLTADAFGWTADRDGLRLSFVSRRASEVLGYPAEAPA